MYSSVYNAERPEVFFKASPDRCVGPFEAVGNRADSDWSVPEPELAFVLYRGEIVGNTIGNDMSSRRSRVRTRYTCRRPRCLTGAAPSAHVSFQRSLDPSDLDISCGISRDGVQVWEDRTSTSQMARTCEELADWLQRHTLVLDLTTVLTGTAIVPPPEFTLREGESCPSRLTG